MAPGRLAGRNLVLLLLLGVLWGVAFMFITLGLRPGDASFSPLLFAALRFDLAGAVLLGVALWRRADLRPRSGAQWLAIGVAAFFNVCLYHALLFVGQPHTTEAVAAVIVGLNPILTTVFSRWLLTDERVGLPGVLGLVMGLAGIALLATLKKGSLLDAQGLGELLIVGAIAAWAVGSILVRRTQHRMDVFAFTAWQMLVGALFLHVGALLFEGGGFARWTGEGAVSLGYLAIVSSAIGFVIYFTLLERLGPIRTNLVSHVAPVFATLAGIVFLGTPFEWRVLVAFVFIAGGFSLVARPARSTG